MNPINNPPSGWLLGFDPGSGIPKALATDFLANNLVPFLLVLVEFLVFALSLIFLIIGGIKLSMAGGDKEGMAKAKNTITYAIVGLVLALSSAIIWTVLKQFFGFNY